MEPVATLGTIPALMDTEATVAQNFDAVVLAHRPRILRFALASLRDRDAAESVAQDCFLRAHKHWDRFRGECSIKTWLMQIAVNLVRDAGRNRRLQFWKKAPAVDMAVASDWLSDRGSSPEERASARQQVVAIWEVVATLSERQRTVFLLHFVEEMNGAEIEAATGITRAAVKVHLFRAVRAVRLKVGRSE